MTIPAQSDAVSERKTKKSGEKMTAVRSSRSRMPATPSLRSSGETDIPSRASPRKSGILRTSFGTSGMSPSMSEPSRPAKAKKRSLAMTTPSGLAIPPSSGRVDESARSKTAAKAVPCTFPLCQTTRPPGKVRAAYFVAMRVLPAAAAKKAQQQEDKHDDQDDPENAHAGHPLSRR